MSAFMEPDHRRLLLALFTALHPFDQESFALHPSLPLRASPYFLPPSLSLALFPPPTSQSFCDGI